MNITDIKEMPGYKHLENNTGIDNVSSGKVGMGFGFCHRTIKEIYEELIVGTLSEEDYPNYESYLESYSKLGLIYPICRKHGALLKINQKGIYRCKEYVYWNQRNRELNGDLGELKECNNGCYQIPKS